jgi:hypothetical protein
VVEARIVVWSEERVVDLRRRLRKAEARFVDDPGKSVTKAAAVVSDAVNALAKALQQQNSQLDPRKKTKNPDTETLRVALRQYKDFLERILAL